MSDAAPDRGFAGPVVYLVACEASADQLGVQLMAALTAETNGCVQFTGVGGPRMTAAGLRSLFDPQELALLGIFEVLPAFRHVLSRVEETVTHIQSVKPAILVTIDSWGFTGRVHQRLARTGSAIPRVRYVAPQVWAWRPGRARQLARWIHHLMTLLPFEPPYFTRYGLPTTWVGHPVIGGGAGKGDGRGFRDRHAIAPETSILAVLPGSRQGEVNRLLPIFAATMALLAKRRGPFTAVIPTVPGVAAIVRAAVRTWPVPVCVVDATEIFDAFAASRAAIAASGTVSLELAIAGVPHIVAYRVNPLSALAFRLLRRTRYVNLINILLDHMAVPELLQGDCRPENLVEALTSLLDDSAVAARQRADFREAAAKLSPAGGSPSRLAARTVLSMIAQ
ncbi:MAG: lipid-A-disaccharide synthase [Rhodospirillaceae bacterium]|nr:MAG: lipid-A-disaccharide synthase [Rhodospirillaceae bacterium]